MLGPWPSRVLGLPYKLPLEFCTCADVQDCSWWRYAWAFSFHWSIISVPAHQPVDLFEASCRFLYIKVCLDLSLTKECLGQQPLLGLRFWHSRGIYCTSHHCKDCKVIYFAQQCSVNSSLVKINLGLQSLPNHDLTSCPSPEVWGTYHLFCNTMQFCPSSSRDSCCTISWDQYFLFWALYNLQLHPFICLRSGRRKTPIHSACVYTSELHKIQCAVQVYNFVDNDIMIAALVYTGVVEYKIYKFRVYAFVFCSSVLVSWLLLSTFDKVVYMNWVYTSTFVKLMYTV